MDCFLKPADTLSTLINEKATELYRKLDALPINQLQLPESVLEYYRTKHDDRKFFSIQTSAELLYRSIRRTNKPVREIVLMDYGAGVGSLFLLAKMIGCKTVIYNDIQEEVKAAAAVISHAVSVPMDLFIAGNHKHTLQVLEEKHILCDIILSRNVIEHIYDLQDFYRDMARYQPQALIYSSTTANYHNPAMLWYHKRLHRRYEKEYAAKREKLIARKLPQLDPVVLGKLTRATRGLAMQDLDDAIDRFVREQQLPDPARHYTNTCDPGNGVWAEHIITRTDYQDIIRPLGYQLEILPAFWDTHNKSSLKNFIGKTMNFLTKALGDRNGLSTTAFIYVIAELK